MRSIFLVASIFAASLGFAAAAVPTTVVTTSRPLQTADARCKMSVKLINGRVCYPLCGRTLAGGDYNLLQSITFNDCVQACGGDHKCVSAEYYEERYWCVLKTQDPRNGLKASSRHDVIICADIPPEILTRFSITTTTTSTSTVRPGPSGCAQFPNPYQGPNRITYGIECGAIYEAPDPAYVIATTDSPNFSNCLDFCSQFGNIRYVDFFGSGGCSCLNNYGGGGLINSPNDSAARVIS